MTPAWIEQGKAIRRDLRRAQRTLVERWGVVVGAVDGDFKVVSVQPSTDSPESAASGVRGGVEPRAETAVQSGPIAAAQGGEQTEVALEPPEQAAAAAAAAACAPRRQEWAAALADFDAALKEINRQIVAHNLQVPSISTSLRIRNYLVLSTI